MSLKRILLITLFLILLPFTLRLHGGDFKQASSLFSDIKAPRVDDIQTVNILEKTQSADEAGPGAVSKCNGVPLIRETPEYIEKVSGRLPSAEKP